MPRGFSKSDEVFAALWTLISAGSLRHAVDGLGVQAEHVRQPEQLVEEMCEFLHRTHALLNLFGIS